MRIRRTVERAWRSDTSQRTAGDRRTLPLANEETSYVVAELPRPDAGRCRSAALDDSFATMEDADARSQDAIQLVYWRN